MSEAQEGRILDLVPSLTDRSSPFSKTCHRVNLLGLSCVFRINERAELQQSENPRAHLKIVDLVLNMVVVFNPHAAFILNLFINQV